MTTELENPEVSSLVSDYKDNCLDYDVVFGKLVAIFMTEDKLNAKKAVEKAKELLK